MQRGAHLDRVVILATGRSVVAGVGLSGLSGRPDGSATVRRVSHLGSLTRVDSFCRRETQVGFTHTAWTALGLPVAARSGQWLSLRWQPEPCLVRGLLHTTADNGGQLVFDVVIYGVLMREPIL